MLLKQAERTSSFFQEKLLTSFFDETIKISQAYFIYNKTLELATDAPFTDQQNGVAAVLGYLRLENTQAPFFPLFLESDQIDTSESLIKKYLLVPSTHRDLFNHQQLDSLVYNQLIPAPDAAAPYTVNPPVSPLRDDALRNGLPPEEPPVANDILLTAPPAHQTMGSQPPT
jgi:hypothetical protein